MMSLGDLADSLIAEDGTGLGNEVSNDHVPDSYHREIVPVVGKEFTRFELENDEEVEQMKEFLEENGFVIIAGVASAIQVKFHIP